MKTPLPSPRAASSTPSSRHSGRRGLARLAGLLLHAVTMSVLLLHAAACDKPEYAQVVHPVDSSDTRTKDIVALSRQVDSLSRFVDALGQTGVMQDLTGYGPWTVFAPVDRAFGRASARLDTIRRGGLADSLRKIVEYHIVRGRVDTSVVNNSRGDSLMLATVFSEPVTMHLRKGGVLTVGNEQIKARIVGRMEAQNGILYIINEVLVLPPPDTTVQTDILFF